MNEPLSVMVMGVSASGKSTVAYKLARRSGYVYLDADWFHSASNIEKMSSGHPLTDDDRRPWLADVGRCARAVGRDGLGVVVACSALKRTYRDELREFLPEMVVVFLDISRAKLEQRVAHRHHHFMPASLLASQLDILEPPTSDELSLRVTGHVKSTASVKRIMKDLSIEKK